MKNHSFALIDGSAAAKGSFLLFVPFRPSNRIKWHRLTCNWPLRSWKFSSKFVRQSWRGWDFLKNRSIYIFLWNLSCSYTVREPLKRSTNLVLGACWLDETRGHKFTKMNGRSERHLLPLKSFFIFFAAEFPSGSNWAQNTFDRAFQELSNGLRTHKFSSS